MHTIVVVGLLSLGGCASAPPRAPQPAVPEGAPAGAPRLPDAPVADAMSWVSTPKDDGWQLAYGVPQSDLLLVALHCAPGQPSIRVSAPIAREWPGAQATEAGWVDAEGRPQPWPALALVQSGTVSFSGEGQATIDEMNGGVWIDTSVPITDPLWESFRRAGSFKVRALNEVVALEAPTPAVAQAFLARCGAGEKP